MRTVEQIMAMSEEKRIQWLADRQTQTEPSEPLSIPPPPEEAPLKEPEIKSEKTEL